MRNRNCCSTLEKYPGMIILSIKAALKFAILLTKEMSVSQTSGFCDKFDCDAKLTLRNIKYEQGFLLQSYRTRRVTS